MDRSGRRTRRPRNRWCRCAGPLRRPEEFKDRYDILVLATGGAPSLPQVEGRDLRGVFALRGLEDGVALRAFIDREKPVRAAIVGAGFIYFSVDKR